MDIVVCVKRFPDTSEAEVTIAKDGQSIEEEDLVFDINDWDRYALEEAVLLKEKLGGSVTAVTMGADETEDTLRRCFATGADNAIRLTDKAFEGSDAVSIARVLYQAIKDLNFDLILTGAQASDDGYGQVGPTLAEFLDISYATLVTSIEVIDGKVRVHRELEDGLEEVGEVQPPALLTIQTGINQPRYVSIMGIRKAARKEIKAQGLNDIGLKEEEVGEASRRTREEKLFLPPVTKEGEMLEGSPDEVATKLAQILKDKGGLA